MRHLRLLLLIGLGLIGYLPHRLAAQTRPSSAPTLWWTDQPTVARAGRPDSADLATFLAAYRPVAVRVPALQAQLAAAPQEAAVRGGASVPLTVQLPLPDGARERFTIAEVATLSPDQQVRFPQIRTYLGYGVDDPTATVALTVSPEGVRAHVRSAHHATVRLEPRQVGNATDHVVFRQADDATYRRAFACGTDVEPVVSGPVPALQRGATGNAGGTPQNRRFGGNLLTYRLGVLATAEYYQYFGSTNASVAAITSVVLNANNYYRNELGVSLILHRVQLFTNSATDGLTNTDKDADLIASQALAVSSFGQANFDVGHVFGTGYSGGVAKLSSVCSANLKARGVTGAAQPLGSGFLHVFVHELGHQFGAGHTFDNATSPVCGPQRAATSAVEPGSGTTIMSYKGFCAGQNVPSATPDDYFHGFSLDQMSFFIANSGGCYQIVNTTNNPPFEPLPQADHYVPAGTPFRLTAWVSDPDYDNLTYCWEEIDALATGSVWVGAQLSQTTQTDGVRNPIFRSYPPTTSPTRYFPDMTAAAYNGISGVPFEQLPYVNRPVHFRCTVRDNRGGVSWQEKVVVNAVVAPSGFTFGLQQPSGAATVWYVGTSALVTWVPATTPQPPINCSHVNIRLSTDGGLTYPHVLATNVPNTGLATVTVPNLPPTQFARVMVEGAGKIFYSFSAQNFRLALPPMTYGGLSGTTATKGSFVKIYGTNLQYTTQVKLGGVPVAYFTAAPDSITVFLGPASTSGVFTVQGPANSFTTDPLTIIPNLDVTSLGATAASWGDQVFIFGDGLAYVNAVRVAGMNVAFAFNPMGRIEFIVPNGLPTGPATVNVYGTNGWDSAPTLLTILGPPNQSPVISPIGQRYGCAGAARSVAFTVADDTTPAAALTVTATSPVQGTQVALALGGTGANRVVLVTPLAGACSTTVTLTVTDGSGNSGQADFPITFFEAADVQIGPPISVPSNEVVRLAPTVSAGVSGIEWNTTGTGHFDNRYAVAPTYYPSHADYIQGSVNLSVVGHSVSSAFPSGCPGVTDQVLVQFTPVDKVFAGDDTLRGVFRNVTVKPGARVTVTGPTYIYNGHVQVEGELSFDAGTCPILEGIGTFTLEAGGALDVCAPDGLVSIGNNGQIRLHSTRTFSPDADYAYRGTGGQVTGDGLPAQVRNLTVDVPGALQLSQDVAVREVLYATRGTLNTMGNELRLLSDANGQAMTVLGGGQVMGDVTVERWISNRQCAGPGYRHLAAPVGGIQFRNLTTPGFTPQVNPAYNTTPNLPLAQFPNIFGYDESRAPSSGTFTQGWYSPAAVADPMTVGQGYSVYMPGGVRPTFTGPLTTTDVTLAGLTRTGNFTGSTQKSGWHLLGNPFAAPLDWELLTLPTGLSRTVSVYQATGPNKGIYKVFQNGLGDPGTKLLGVGQGFFVRVTGSAPVALTLPVAACQTTYASPLVGRPGTVVSAGLRLEVHAADAPASETDALYLYFDPTATDVYDAALDGARPAANVGIPTLAARKTGESLAIAALPAAWLTGGGQLPLAFEAPAPGQYQIRVGAWTQLAGTRLALWDRQTGRSHELHDGFALLVEVATAGLQANRFELRFNGGGAAITEAKLAVWPNPAHGEVRVSLAATAAKTTCQLIDDLGRIVREWPVPANTTEAVLRLSDVRPGLYVLRAGCQNYPLVVE